MTQRIGWQLDCRPVDSGSETITEIQQSRSLSCYQSESVEISLSPDPAVSWDRTISASDYATLTNDQWPPLTNAQLVTYHLSSPRRLASGEGIVAVGVCVSVCLCVRPAATARFHPAATASVSAAKVMRRTQCSSVTITITISQYLRHGVWFRRQWRKWPSWATRTSLCPVMSLRHTNKYDYILTNIQCFYPHHLKKC